MFIPGLERMANAFVTLQRKNGNIRIAQQYLTEVGYEQFQLEAECIMFSSKRINLASPSSPLLPFNTAANSRSSPTAIALLAPV